FIANNNDPHICNIDLPAEAAEKKYLFLKQICKTSDKDQISFAQLFWQSDTNSSYSEEYSVTFPIYPDGKVHNYLVNLEEYTNKIPTKWRNSTNIQRLRFDPMCNSGIFQILEFQFL
ncbi:MAG: hypothetical protein KBC84_02835, partial [Proteobacteria bacterium]|nr:hypothetical protein [Pseudomonadota bacterium]